ncbi:hypothetical protein DICVIV_10339 [Dictyocaulus viviparus]|uniref:WD repeat-containing protein 54 beta-propeller domain-containing protein n=1 Tax=Dictyocaulus viviparus TaxID=29172 RepID=A0A0D8XGA0_DICVI|nr:hypothetical protein DICVIV_10339 [Dictyocaulus viviparus]
MNLRLRSREAQLSQLHAQAEFGEKENDDNLSWSSFCRGITCNENFILVGTSFGHIIQFQCNSELSISTKKYFKEHSASIVDLATCCYDLITCSGDSSGLIIIWNKNFKGVQVKIATEHPITAMSILRKQIIVGTLRGRIILYSATGGELKAEVEYRHSDELPNCLIMGAQFTNGRGSDIALACFDRNMLFRYRLCRKNVS